MDDLYSELTIKTAALDKCIKQLRQTEGQIQREYGIAGRGTI